MHPAQVPDSDPSLFSARRLQLSLCFEGKMAHLVGVQESRFVVTQFSLQLRQRSVSVVASCGSLRILRRLKTFVCSMRTRAGSWSHFRSTVAHLLQQFFMLRTGIMVISVWWQETLDLLKRLCPIGIPVITMIDANAEVGSEVSPFIRDKDAAEKTFSTCHSS